MVFLVGAEPVDSVDVFGVRHIEMGERHHDGGPCGETSEKRTKKREKTRELQNISNPSLAKPCSR